MSSPVATSWTGDFSRLAINRHGPAIRISIVNPTI
jgi:hypothetical protein